MPIPDSQFFLHICGDWLHVSSPGILMTGVGVRVVQEGIVVLYEHLVRSEARPLVAVLVRVAAPERLGEDEPGLVPRTILTCNDTTCIIAMNWVDRAKPLLCPIVVFKMLPFF